MLFSGTPLKKQPSEKLIRTMDFGPWMEDGETLTSQGLDVKVWDGAVDVTSQLLETSNPAPTVSGTFLTVMVKGGVDGKIYKLEAKVNTSAGQLLEGELELDVKEI